MVGVTGFGPAISCSQSRRDTNLPYTPVGVVVFETTTSWPPAKRAAHLRHTPLCNVGITGFEPAASRPRTARSSQAELHPVEWR